MIMVRCRKKDHLSITKEEYELEQEEDTSYLTRVELFTLEEIKAYLQ